MSIEDVKNIMKYVDAEMERMDIIIMQLTQQQKRIKERFDYLKSKL